MATFFYNKIFIPIQALKCFATYRLLLLHDLLTNDPEITKLDSRILNQKTQTLMSC